MNTSRVPQGVPTGGQFSAAERSEPVMTLAGTQSNAPCFGCGHQHDAASPGRCWEATCVPGCVACGSGDAIEAEYDEPPSCSICDGLGHGYPGGPPCPLEVNEVQRWETDEDERRAQALGLDWTNQTDEPSMF